MQRFNYVHVFLRIWNLFMDFCLISFLLAFFHLFFSHNVGAQILECCNEYPGTWHRHAFCIRFHCMCINCRLKTNTFCFLFEIKTKWMIKKDPPISNSTINIIHYQLFILCICVWFQSVVLLFVLFLFCIGCILYVSHLFHLAFSCCFFRSVSR